MKNIKVQNNQVIIEVPEFKSRRQSAYFNDLIKSNELELALNYIRSFQGTAIRMGRKRAYLKSDESDPLVEKSPGHYNKILQSLVSPSRSWTPRNIESIFKTKHQDYIGVEIECFLSRDDFDVNFRDTESEIDCPDCEGTGTTNCGRCDAEHDCSRCEGTGRIYDEDSNEEDDNRVEAVSQWVRKLGLRGVSVAEDGSIDADDSDYFGIEFRVLARVGDMKNLDRLCAELKKIGAKVNKTCGLHVHFDARHLDEDQARQLGLKIGKTIPALAKMVPKSRRDNRYCRLGVSSISEGAERYYAVNLQSYHRHGTIEIRLHSGTTDFDKIKNWVLLINAIATGPEFTQDKVYSLRKLVTALNIDQSVKDYALARERLFGDGEGTYQTDQTQLELADNAALDADDLDQSA